MGFTLAFGAMFSKVWRVHRFTTKAKTDPKVNFFLILSDTQTFFLLWKIISCP